VLVTLYDPCGNDMQLIAGSEVDTHDSLPIRPLAKAAMSKPLGEVACVGSDAKLVYPGLRIPDKVTIASLWGRRHEDSRDLLKS
jgi:hypothetical protein